MSMLEGQVTLPLPGKNFWKVWLFLHKGHWPTHSALLLVLRAHSSADHSLAGSLESMGLLGSLFPCCLFLALFWLLGGTAGGGLGVTGGGLAGVLKAGAVVDTARACWVGVWVQASPL